MNLVEQLLKADKTTLELETGVFYSKRLQKFLNAKEAVPVSIRQIPARKQGDISSMAFDKKGNKDASKLYDAYLMFCVQGVTDPSLKDEGLLKKFGAATPKDLAEKLFDDEVVDLANAITNLGDDSTEDDVKN